LVIGVDGVDGSGKTTLVAGLLAEFGPRLATVATKPFGSVHDLRVATLPGAPTVGQVLYDFALNDTFGFDAVETQLALTICIRRHERAILGKLRAENRLVLTDRSVMSAAAYGHVTDARMGELVAWAVEPLAAEDLVFWLDVEPAIAFERRTPKEFVLEAGTDTVGVRGVTYQRLAAERFARVVRDSDFFLRVDAAQDAEDVRTVVARAIDTLLS
jgi:thymidylate kinase